MEPRNRFLALSRTVFVVAVLASAVMAINWRGLPGRPAFDASLLLFGSILGGLLFIALRALANGPFRVRFGSACGRAIPIDSALCPSCGHRIA